MPDMISCERGIGRMFDGSCANRWRIANGKKRASKEAEAAIRADGRCSGCEHGAKRAAEKPKAPAPFVLPPETLARTHGARPCLRCGRPFERRRGNETYCDRCRFSAVRPEPVTAPAPKPMPKPLPIVRESAYAPQPPQELPPAEFELRDAVDAPPAEQQESAPGPTPAPQGDSRMRTAQCTTCPKTFKAAPTGRLPKQCPDCKSGTPKRALSAPQRRARKIEGVEVDHAEITAELLDIMQRRGLVPQSVDGCVLADSGKHHVLEVHDDKTVIVRVANPAQVRIELLEHR